MQSLGICLSLTKAAAKVSCSFVKSCPASGSSQAYAGMQLLLLHYVLMLAMINELIRHLLGQRCLAVRLAEAGEV